MYSSPLHIYIQKAFLQCPTSKKFFLKDFAFRTYRYPRIRRRSVHQPSRSRHMAVSCSLQCPCELAYSRERKSLVPHQLFFFFFFLRWRLLDKIRTDGCRENCRQRVRSPAGLALSRCNGNCRSSSHFCRLGRAVGRWPLSSNSSLRD